jgi:hypothetical protein
MDARLEKALDFSNFRMIIATRQKNLKSLFENKLILYYEGGIFKVTTEFLSFLVTIIMREKQDGFIFIDQNEIPIYIKDLDDFYNEAFKKYKSAIKQYYDSYQKLSEAREIRKALDWDDEK